MSRLRIPLALLVVVGIPVATPLAAQERSPVSLEASVGVGVGRSSERFRESTGLALDATLASRIRRTPSGAVIVALSGGGQGILTGVTSLCEPMPDGNCAPAYPGFYSLAALAGREWTHGVGASVRALAGPAYYRADWRSGGGGALGLQARVDVTTPPLWRVALLGSFRGALLPSFHGSRHTLGAIGLGLRVQ